MSKMLELLREVNNRRDYYLDWVGRDHLPFKKINADETDPIPPLNIEGLKEVANMLGFSLWELYRHYKKQEHRLNWLWWVSSKNLCKALDEFMEAIKTIHAEEEMARLQGWTEGAKLLYRIETVFGEEPPNSDIIRPLLMGIDTSLNNGGGYTEVRSSLTPAEPINAKQIRVINRMDVINVNYRNKGDEVS